MNNQRKPWLPIVLVFIILNGFITIFKTFLENKGLEREFLIIANLIFFLLTLAAFFIQKRGVLSDNPNAFVRGIYGSFLLKLFVCIIAVTVYGLVFKQHINKMSIFFSLGLYIVYTSLEVAALMKLARAKKNVKN